MFTVTQKSRSSVNGSIKYEDFLRVLPQARDLGRYIVGVCPFHNDDDPSLLVFQDGRFHCLGADCAASGTWRMLWNRLSGQPIQVARERRIHYHSPEGLNEFSNREELAYEAHRNLTTFTSFQWYLEMRGVADAVELQEIGYWRGWYTFPVWNSEYKFQNVIFRAAPHVQDAIDMRYWADGKPTMYVPDWHLLNTSEYIVIVFGILDALTLNKFRYPVISPTHGHTFHSEWLASYRKPIFVIPDKGEERAALRLTANLGWRGKMVRLDWPQGMKDANDFLRAGKQDDLLSQLEKKLR